MSAEKDQVVAELDVFSCRTLLGEQTQASTLYQGDLSDLMEPEPKIVVQLVFDTAVGSSDLNQAIRNHAASLECFNNLSDTCSTIQRFFNRSQTYYNISGAGLFVIYK